MKVYRTNNGYYYKIENGEKFIISEEEYLNFQDHSTNYEDNINYQQDIISNYQQNILDLKGGAKTKPTYYVVKEITQTYSFNRYEITETITKKYEIAYAKFLAEHTENEFDLIYKYQCATINDNKKEILIKVKNKMNTDGGDEYDAICNIAKTYVPANIEDVQNFIKNLPKKWQKLLSNMAVLIILLFMIIPYYEITSRVKLIRILCGLLRRDWGTITDAHLIEKINILNAKLDVIRTDSEREKKKLDELRKENSIIGKVVAKYFKNGPLKGDARSHIKATYDEYLSRLYFHHMYNFNLYWEFDKKRKHELKSHYLPPSSLEKVQTTCYPEWLTDAYLPKTPEVISLPSRFVKDQFSYESAEVFNEQKENAESEGLVYDGVETGLPEYSEKSMIEFKELTFKINDLEYKELYKENIFYPTFMPEEGKFPDNNELAPPRYMYVAKHNDDTPMSLTVHDQTCGEGTKPGYHYPFILEDERTPPKCTSGAIPYIRPLLYREDANLPLAVACDTDKRSMKEKLNEAIHENLSSRRGYHHFVANNYPADGEGLGEGLGELSFFNDEVSARVKDVDHWYSEEINPNKRGVKKLADLKNKMAFVRFVQDKAQHWYNEKYYRGKHWHRKDTEFNELDIGEGLVQNDEDPSYLSQVSPSLRGEIAGSYDHGSSLFQRIYNPALSGDHPGPRQGSLVKYFYNDIDWVKDWANNKRPLYRQDLWNLTIDKLKVIDYQIVNLQEDVKATARDALKEDKEFDERWIKCRSIVPHLHKALYKTFSHPMSGGNDDENENSNYLNAKEGENSNYLNAKGGENSNYLNAQSDNEHVVNQYGGASSDNIDDVEKLVEHGASLDYQTVLEYKDYDDYHAVKLKKGYIIKGEPKFWRESTSIKLSKDMFLEYNKKFMKELSPEESELFIKSNKYKNRTYQQLEEVIPDKNGVSADRMELYEDIWETSEISTEELFDVVPERDLEKSLTGDLEESITLLEEKMESTESNQSAMNVILGLIKVSGLSPLVPDLVFETCELSILKYGENQDIIKEILKEMIPMLNLKVLRLLKKELLQKISDEDKLRLQFILFSKKHCIELTTSNNSTPLVNSLSDIIDVIFDAI